MTIDREQDPTLWRRPLRWGLAGGLAAVALVSAVFGLAAWGDDADRCFSELPASDTCSDARKAGVFYGAISVASLIAGVFAWRKLGA